MASGRYENGSTSASYIKTGLIWQSTPNTAENTSEVTVTLIAANIASGSGYVDGTGGWYIHIDGQISPKQQPYVMLQAGGGWIEVCTWTTTVAHETDGSKSIKIQATGGISSASAWNSTTCGLIVELDRIVQSASTATVNSPMAVDGVTRSYVAISGAPGVFHTVKWAFGEYEHTTVGAETFAYLTVPAAWLAAIPTETSGTCRITVTTYSDRECTQQIGEPYELSAVWTVPAGMAPTAADGWAAMSPVQTVENAPAGTYIAGVSKAQVTFDTSKVTAPAGTTISGYRITYGGQNYESPFITPLLSAGALSVTATVTDARGRSTSTTLTAEALAYANPALSGISVYRSTSAGTGSDVGTYAAVTATANVSSLNGANTYSLTARIKQAGGEYGEARTLASGEQMLISGIETDANYYVMITLTDALGNSAASETLIAAGESGGGGGGPTLLGMHLLDGGTGAGFGCTAEDGYMAIAYASGLKIKNGKLIIGETEISEAQLQALLSLL